VSRAPLRWIAAAALATLAVYPTACAGGCGDPAVEPRTYPSRAPHQKPHQDPEAYFAPASEPDER